MSTSRIPILDLSAEVDSLWAELNNAIQKVLRSTQFINGPEVKQFEEQVAKYLGTKHAVGLNSGTDALVIGLRALGIEAGDEVITTSFTFFATAEAISMLGAKPIFVDIDPNTFNIDATKIESVITSRTRAIIPVHLYGHAADMDAIVAIARKHNLKILEDVAQAFSGSFRSQKLGTIGDVGAYSFFPSKNLGAYGDGGLLTTNDDRIAEQAIMLRAHGAKKKYFNEMVGYNSRLDTLQAAILQVKLPHIESASNGRRLVASRYNELLSNLKDVITPKEGPNCRHVFHQYTVRILGNRRDQVQKYLADAGIETMIYYPKPVHRLPIYADQGFSLPVTEQLATEVLSLPIWPQMSIEKQQRVADTLASAIK